MFLEIVLLLGIVVVLWKYYTKQRKDLELKHVVVTGGSSGIGKHVAILAAGRGAHVTIIARNENKLRAAKDEILKSCKHPDKQQIKIISLDVTNYNNVKNIMEDLDKELPIYMLVNCAGMAICGVLEHMAVEDIRSLVDLNILGTIYPIQSVLVSMKRRRSGIIVITASQAAFLGIYGLGVYSATKFALRGLAESLYMELKPYNVTITLSTPPDTNTPGFENENKNKPLETQLISESGGLYEPDVVANTLINDALGGQFFSYTGFESFMVSTLCCGMTPFASILEVIVQSILLGPFRLISSYYILHFARTIQKCKDKNENI